MTPLASESTSLLPQGHPDDETRDGDTRRRKSRCHGLMFVGAALLVTLSFGIFAALYTSDAADVTNESPSTQSVPGKSGQTRQSESSSAAASFALDEATLLLWDDWKFQTSKAKSWWEEKHKNEDEKGSNVNMTSLRNQAQALGSEVHSWWNASGDERVWFLNATAENAERFCDQVKDWWHNVQNTTSAGKRAISGNSLGEKEEALEHNFQAWWEHANEEERSWWNATVQQLQHDKRVGGGWLHELKQKSETVAEKGREWLDSTKSALKNDESAASKVERNLWNETKRNVHDDESAIEGKFSLWWNLTKTISQKSLNATTEKEEEWWNATEHWFQDHVRQQHSAENYLDAGALWPLLYLNSTFAYSLLMNGYHWYDYSADFFLLQSGWDAQINQAYCGVASSAAVLNSLRSFVSPPVDPIYAPHPYATQLDLFNNNCVQENVIRRNDTYDGLFHAPSGLSLEQIKRLLECNLVDDGWKVAAHHVDPETVTVDDVYHDLVEALRNPAKRVMVNFDRRALGQEGGGHFSPLGSYSNKANSYLIMDPAKYRYPPFWVPAERLFAAMATEDSCGDWDYPNAQDKLRQDRRPATRKEYEKEMRKLGCHEMYRGYIIIESTGQEL